MATLPVPHRDEPVASYDERSKTVAVNDNWHRFFGLLQDTLAVAFGTDNPAGTIGSAAYANIASVDEVRQAATGSKVLVAEHLQTAAERVAIAYAASLAWDWKAGINFKCTLTGDTQIQIPSNGIPGTYRTISFVGDSATPRIVTFVTTTGGFGGEDQPVMEDVTSTKHYKVTISCEGDGTTVSHFLATAQDTSPP